MSYECITESLTIELDEYILQGWDYVSQMLPLQSGTHPSLLLQP